MDTGGGVTVWFNRALEGNVTIEYDWKVVVAGGRNDRLSDLNQFWMASERDGKAPAARSGVFEEYDAMQLYYVGFGGNTNTTTRFRRYRGEGRKELIREYTDPTHLLRPNHQYHIRIEIRDGQQRYFVDNMLYFEWKDPEPLIKGYFGFRSTWARHAIANFRVWQEP